MMIAEAYLSRSRLFRRLKSGPHGQLIELYAARPVKDGLARHGMASLARLSFAGRTSRTSSRSGRRSGSWRSGPPM
jgi:hypothetical protein